MALPTKQKKQTEFALPKENYRWILLGVCVIVLGFILMSGGGADTPYDFSYKIFSFRRITLAPIVVLGGFATVFYGIMRKGKKDDLA